MATLRQVIRQQRNTRTRISPSKFVRQGNTVYNIANGGSATYPTARAAAAAAGIGHVAVGAGGGVSVAGGAGGSGG